MTIKKNSTIYPYMTSLKMLASPIIEIVTKNLKILNFGEFQLNIVSTVLI